MIRLSDLNPQQRRAVTTTDGPVLVLAGAGTGKTRVITYRVAHLLSRGAKPEEILAVTFTNKAAAEMRDRVGALVGKRGCEGLTVSTFHAFGLRMLRANARTAGLRANFTIYGTGNQLGVVREALRETVSAGVKVDPMDALVSISAAKNAGIAADGKAADAAGEETWLKARCYQRYQKKLRARNAVDFDDLLLKPLALLRKDKAVRERYAGRFRYILVDEYQDTNAVQHELVRLLASRHGNVCAVGDDDQSIYAWRGARPDNVLRFQKDFPGTEVIKLERNYRSTPQVLALANAVLAGAPRRIEKRLYTDIPRGPSVQYFELEDEEAEADLVVRTIRDNHSRKGLALHAHAILYRANAQSRLFEEKLRRWDVPYVIVGGQSFYERREIQDVLAWLHVIANPADDLSFRRVVNVPPRGMGEKAVGRLEDLAAAARVSLREALRRAADDDETPPVLRRPIQRLETALSGWEAQMAAGPMAETAARMIQEMGYGAELERLYGPEDGVRRRENVEALVTALAQFEKAGRGDLAAFLDEAALLEGEEEAEGAEDTIRGDAVTLITIHSCKGLEFRHVFLVGCEEGLLPHRRSVADEDMESLAEERRLCYVAVTRARERLTLSRARTRTRWGKDTVTTPSRFFEEVPQELLERTRDGRLRSGDDAGDVRGHYLGRIKAKMGARRPKR
jgi:superfamily I DNA/RNA helicase